MRSFHHAPKAKRVIYLFQFGAPSQMDLFDYKPRLNQDHGKELPESVFFPFLDKTAIDDDKLPCKLLTINRIGRNGLRVS